jgi:predicted extracellular nuclease
VQLAERAGNTIILGDFNIFQKQDNTMKALEDAGFIEPSGVSCTLGVL